MEEEEEEEREGARPYKGRSKERFRQPDGSICRFVKLILDWSTSASRHYLYRIKLDYSRVE